MRSSLDDRGFPRRDVGRDPGSVLLVAESGSLLRQPGLGRGDGSHPLVALLDGGEGQLVAGVQEGEPSVRAVVAVPQLIDLGEIPGSADVDPPQQRVWPVAGTGAGDVVAEQGDGGEVGGVLLELRPGAPGGDSVLAPGDRGIGCVAGSEYLRGLGQGCERDCGALLQIGEQPRRLGPVRLAGEPAKVAVEALDLAAGLVADQGGERDVPKRRLDGLGRSVDVQLRQVGVSDSGDLREAAAALSAPVGRSMPSASRWRVSSLNGEVVNTVRPFLSR